MYQVKQVDQVKLVDQVKQVNQVKQLNQVKQANQVKQLVSSLTRVTSVKLENGHSLTDSLTDSLTYITSRASCDAKKEETKQTAGRTHRKQY